MSISLIKRLTFLLAAIFLVLIVAAIFLWTRFRTVGKPAFLSPPNPNAYELFLQAEKQLQGVDPRSVTNNIGLFVTNHAGLFTEFEKALSYSAEAPARMYDAAGMPLDFMNFKRLALAILLKAKHAEHEKRWNDATHVYLKLIRCGQKLEHGPLINFMVGSTIELMAIKPLGNLMQNLTDQELSEVTTNLLTLNRTRIDFNEVKRRELYFMRVNSPHLFKFVRERYFSKSIFDSAHQRYVGTTTSMELVATSMAIRRWELAEKKPISRFADLVPKYLPFIPADAYRNQPLLLSSLGTNTIIYSVGPNKIDDGGKKDDVLLNHRDTAGAEIMIDALSRLGSD